MIANAFVGSRFHSLILGYLDRMGPRRGLISSSASDSSSSDGRLRTVLAGAKRAAGGRSSSVVSPSAVDN